MEFFQSVFCVFMSMAILLIGYVLAKSADEDERKRREALKTLEKTILEG